MISSSDSPSEFQNRVQYFRHRRGISRFVIYDVDSNGVERFSCQDPGDVRWFEFEPSDAERDAARQLLAKSRERSD